MGVRVSSCSGALKQYQKHTPVQVFANECNAVIDGLPSLEDEKKAFFPTETAGVAPVNLTRLEAESSGEPWRAADATQSGPLDLPSETANNVQIPTQNRLRTARTIRTTTAVRLRMQQRSSLSVMERRAPQQPPRHSSCIQRLGNLTHWLPGLKRSAAKRRRRSDLERTLTLRRLLLTRFSWTRQKQRAGR